MRVILATGIEEIDAGVREKLSAENIAEMVKECYYREGVLPLAKGKRAEVVVISPQLPGQTEMIELIKEIRKADMRVVFLPGREDDRRAVEMGNKAAAHGVYDIAWDPVSVDEVVKLILNPNTYSRAGARPDEESVNVFKEKASKKSVLNFFLRKRNGKAEYDKKEELAETCTVEEDFQRVGEFDSSPAAFPEKQRIPEDFAVLGSEEFPSVRELCAALPGNYSAVVVPAGWPDLADAIRELRRNPAASALPIVVVGPCDAAKCYAAGADECVEELDLSAMERIRAKAVRKTQAEKVDLQKRPAEKTPPPPARGTPSVESEESGFPPDVYRDLLTGCYARRFLLEKFSVVGNYSVVFIDLDDFKPVNDILGHEAGDKVLAAFGKMLSEQLKGRDLAVRWGGDEFVLILPETSPRAAEKVVENLRVTWEKCAPDTGNLKVGFSAGIASGRGIAELPESIKAADKAMYAKKSAHKTKMPVAYWETAPDAQVVCAPSAGRETPWEIAKQSALGFFVIVEIIILLSAGIWITNYVLIMMGKENALLTKITALVVEFWKMVYMGIFG